MNEFAIDDLTIITGGQQPTGIKIKQPAQGFESPDYRLNQFSNPGRHGGTTSSSLYDFRRIQLEGSIKGNTYEEYYALRRQLLSAVSIQHDDNLNPVPHRVTFTTLDGQAYYADVHFNKPLMAIQHPMYSEFMITGTIDTGLIFGQAIISSGNISRPTGGGFESPFISPFISEASTGGTVTITNSGDEMAWPTVDNDGNGGIILTGSLTNPVLTNLTTGRKLELDYTLQSGDFIQIDMLKQLVLLNGSSTLISTKTSTSDWWGIAPGPNSISLSTTAGTDGGYASISFNPAYQGV